ncbi:histidine kinase [Pseudovibrio exalbescens]|nr:histidine kinase [Pseudovibrio exalbescens]
MPTLTRLLSLIGLGVITVVLAMYALSTFVEPTPREITVSVEKDW